MSTITPEQLKALHNQLRQIMVNQWDCSQGAPNASTPLVQVIWIRGQLRMGIDTEAGLLVRTEDLSHLTRPEQWRWKLKFLNNILRVQQRDPRPEKWRLLDI